jgi:hypothetical protein
VKSETEIREKLKYYEAMLKALESWKMIDNQEILRRVSRYFPSEVMEILNNLTHTEGVVELLPAEDQAWVTQWHNSLDGFAREVLTSRISILRWALEAKKESGGGDR